MLKKQFVAVCLSAIVIFTGTAYAQLNRVFEDILKQVLITDFVTSTTSTNHKEHYKPAANDAIAKLTPALNSLIADNVSSFPLSSTVAGVSFDFSSGRPVSMTESLGPIFAETAQTLGKRQANIGFSYTYLSLAKFRGLPTEDISFIFTHQETGQAPLGDDPSEQDLVGLALGLDVNAAILAFSGTYGVTDNFDLGIAVPVVHVGLKVDGAARVIQPSSAVITFHQFNKDPSDPLVDPVTRDESATGLGDIALRLKYRLQRGAGVDLAALLDVRLPTGSEEDFLGTGKINTRLSWIMSKKLDNFTPHLNLSYARRSADFDSDQLEFTLGFDRKLANGFSIAAEFFGGFALNRDETIQLLPGTAPITFSTGVRQVDLSNVPERNRDNVLNAALGFRAAPSEKLSLLGNVIIALNDGGLRSSVVPTFGANLSF